MKDLNSLSIPEGASHIRRNLKKNTVAIFRELQKDCYEIYNKGRWERYKDHNRGIIPLSTGLNNHTVKTPQRVTVKEEPEKYIPQVPTFKERVFETIPEPVLRQLVHYYENHDVVEVELNVKMTSVIKG